MNPHHPVWVYMPSPTDQEAEALQKVLHTSLLSSKLLLQRGIDTFAKAKTFFNPTWDSLHDPMQMKGMELALVRIERALAQGEHIRIYGDYDVDGTTAVALLYQGLTKLGGDVSYYIPDRYQEGYGLSMEGVQKALDDNVDLLICVDCGTRAVENIQKAQDNGLEVIICDHHEVGPTLPKAHAILNPKQKDCPYPFKELSACGIVFKLLQALVKKGHALLLQDHLELVALSIAADIVPMVDENRVLAFLGLQQLNRSPSLGVKILKEKVRGTKALTISDVVFGLAPPINAAGRLAHAHKAVQLFLANSEEEAEKYAHYLVNENQTRRAMDKALALDAMAMIAEKPDQYAYVLYNASWSKGLVGIGAARCVETHYRPTILLTHQEGDVIVGSARSIKGYNIYEGLQACSQWLLKYGGHAHAAGLSLSLKNLDAFRSALAQHAATHLKEQDLTPKIYIDATITLDQITDLFVQLLQRFGPFGPGNRSPLFASEKVKVVRHVVYQGKHLKLWVQQKEGPLWEAIAFDSEAQIPLVEKHKEIDIAYKIERQMYQGAYRNQLQIKALKVRS